ncbi:linear amide C-N hydrolase [Chachezhania sediminis]|uniref:linear amide C-N hydrolase n=1 Tax=Chachezhania sediminis TaxID=2599291 RepID=UPI00131E58B8|nr:choloylglycine hydrolase family protein [Chachezhania sediminis]
MPATRTLRRLAAGVAALALSAQSALACTGIVLHADNGDTIFGRTMEFGLDLESELLAVPAGTKIETLVMNPDKTGFSYTTKYGFVGMNGLNAPIAIDAMNSEGLHFGAFFFAGPAVFPEVTDETQPTALSSEEVGNWILGNFATVAEVREAIHTVNLVGTPIQQLGSVAPLHYSVVDASGDAIVIEQTTSGLTIYDNTVNVIANNPTYDWHLTNLRNYIGLTDLNLPAVTVGRQKLEPFGQGTGLEGLPGNGSSPARFVRAVAFANTAQPMKDGDEGVFRAFHILNNFDIPRGSVVENPETGQPVLEYTEWTSVADTKNRVYYFKTYEAQAATKVDIKAALDGLTVPSKQPLETTFQVIDATKGF